MVLFNLFRTQAIPGLFTLLASLLAEFGKPAPELQELIDRLEDMFTAWKNRPAQAETDPDPDDEDEDVWEWEVVYARLRDPRPDSVEPHPRSHGLPPPRIRRKIRLAASRPTAPLLFRYQNN